MTCETILWPVSSQVPPSPLRWLVEAMADELITVEPTPLVVDVPHMGVGDVTGPLGIVLAVVLGLDRFGLLRRGSGASDPPSAVPAHHRDEFVELKTNVQHLQERIAETRDEARRHRDRTAATLDQIRDDIRRALAE